MTAATVYCNDTELKPCPFCGSAAKLAARWTRRGYIGFVQCEFCEAQTRPFAVECFDPDTFDDEGFTRAAARWQRRERGISCEGGSNARD